MLSTISMDLYIEADHPMNRLCAAQVAKTLKQTEINLKKYRGWWYFFRHGVIYPAGDSGPYECGTWITLLSAM